jgi:sugar phosphate isomerase/epimerase
MKDYRGKFPFKLATTSYIYPDEIVPNVARLAPSFDEIELVLFESARPDSIPGDAKIGRLKELSSQHRIGFNIHLPTDISLGDQEEATRLKGVCVVKEVMERTRPLYPSVYTLHLDLINPPIPPFGKGGRRGDFPEENDVESWRKRLRLSLEEILTDGIEPQRISIETLGYPFEWIEDLIEVCGFSICLDIGHILMQGRDLNRHFEKYLSKTSIIHLHGFNGGRDHVGIDCLGEDKIDSILFGLRNYRGILSIEVFSLRHLMSSLEALEQRWTRRR